MCVQVLSHGHGHVFERESKHMLRCCTLMCLCVCVRVCHQVHEHVCVHERECMVQVHVCGHVCMCVWHICRAPPWTHEARDSEQAMPAHLVREEGTAVGLIGDVMGMSWGSGHTDHRDSRLWASYSPPEAWEGLAGPKGCRRSSDPRDIPSLLALC